MNANEMIADIVAEKRERAQVIRQSLSTVPDRRDAQIAEAEELESDADRIDAASVGNCAAMRHAIVIAVGDLQSNLEMTPDERQFMARYLKAAIDKPARNCDRFDSCAEAKAEWWKTEVLPRVYGVVGGEEPPFNEWLFAPATAKKGEADESK